jgi:ABC-2 type transport system permease protein
MHLIRAELTRAWTLSARAPFHFVFGCFLLAGLFYAFQSGYEYLLGANPEMHGGSGAIGSYLLWMLAANGMLYASGETEKDIQTGTIQHLYMSATPLHLVAGIRSAIGILHTFGVVIIVLAIIYVLQGWRHIAFDPPTVFAALDASIVGIGLGLAACGMALVIRPLPLILLPFQLLLLASSAVHTLPEGPLQLPLFLLPLYPASVLLSAGEGLGVAWPLVMAVHALAYVLLGGVVLSLCEKAARIRGTILT